MREHVTRRLEMGDRLTRQFGVDKVSECDGRDQYFPTGRGVSAKGRDAAARQRRETPVKGK